MELMNLKTEISSPLPTLDPTVPAGLLPVTVALSYRDLVSVKNYTSTVTPPLVFGFYPVPGLSRMSPVTKEAAG